MSIRLRQLLCISALFICTAAWPQARDASRLPPTVSHQQTMQLFAQERYDEAFKAAKHRFEWGDEDLHYPLGMMLRKGLGTQRNGALAREHFALAARRGDLRGQYQLAEMLRLGEGGRRDQAEACRLYQSAQRQNVNAGFQAAICALEAGDRDSGLKGLHALARDEHAAATHRLLLHVRKQGQQQNWPDETYRSAVNAWLRQDHNEARRLARKALRHGDYRAYAVLGEVARAQGNSTQELPLHQVELGRLFGSSMPQYAAGLRLQAQGHEQAACGFFLQAFQRGFSAAGTRIGQCMQARHIKPDDSGKSACDYFAAAFLDGDPNSSRAWIACQLEDNAEAHALARSYARAKFLDPDFSDAALATQLCQERPRHIAVANATIEIWPSGQRSLSKDTEVCELSREGATILAFAPQAGWLSQLKPYALSLPISRHGLSLQGLTKSRIDLALSKTNSRLNALQQHPDQYVLQPKSSTNIEIRLDYAEDGSLKRYIETCRACRDDNFTWRRQRLEEHFGAAKVAKDSASFQLREWQIQNWDIQLMMKPKDGQMREIYRTRR